MLHGAAQTTTFDSLRIQLGHLGIKEGLSQGFVRSIIQDREGFMWFSSKDGLNQYDGYRFRVIRGNSLDSLSLPDNHVSVLLEDNKGRFWIGTESKGLYLFDKKHETFHRVFIPGYEDIGKYDGVKEMRYQDEKLLLAYNNNIVILNVEDIVPGDFSTANLKRGKIHLNLNQQVVDGKYHYNDINYASYLYLRNGTLMMATTDTVLFLTPDKVTSRWKKTYIPLARFGLFRLKTEAAQMLNTNCSDTIILTSLRYFSVFSLRQNKILFHQHFQHQKNSFVSLQSDAKGNIYYGNANGGYYFNIKEMKMYSVDAHPAPVRNWLCMCADKDGMLWISSNQSDGLYLYDERKLRFKNTQHHGYYQYLNGKVKIFAQNFNSLAVIPEGKLLPLKFKAGYNLFIPKRLLKESDSTFLITTFHGDNNGLWLYRFNHEQDMLSAVKLDSSWHHFTDAQGNLWGLYASPLPTIVLVQIDKSTGKILHRFPFPKSNFIHEYPFISDIIEEDGLFWFGTLQGLYRFDTKANEDGKRWQWWKKDTKHNNTLRDDLIFSICKDPRHPNTHMWLGSNGHGLFNLNLQTGICKHYDVTNGLPNNVVYSMLSDNEGNIWMSTNFGISCFNPSNELFRNFSEDDGLCGNEFNRYEKIKTPKGELIFGGVNGSSAFYPHEILKSGKASPIVFTELHVYNKLISHQEHPEVIQQPLNYAEVIHLAASQNMFTISFALLETVSPEKKKYAYYLEGLDETWIPNGNKTSATYTNLSPGTYTLHVKGCNAAGIWTMPERSLRIVIAAFWYQTWWFRLSALAFVFVGIYGLYRFRMNQLLKLQHLRNSIARDLHDEIGSTLSSISLYGESARMMIDEKSPLQHVLNKINQSTLNIMEAMSDIVWTINSKNDHVDNLINRMHVFANQLMETKKVKIHFTTDEESEKLVLDMNVRKNFYFLFKEIINNVARHSDCKNLWIDIRVKHTMLSMVVRDDGKGFDVERDANNLGKLGGNGLHNMRKRADDMNAQVEIHSQLGKGCTIHLVMKI